MIKCSGCGRDNEDSYSFCQDCGAKLESSIESPLTSAAKARLDPNPGLASIAKVSTESRPVLMEDNQRTSVLERFSRSTPIPIPAEEKKVTREPTSPRIPAVKAVAAKICRNCGAEVSEGFTFCGLCGRPFDSDGKETAGETANPNPRKGRERSSTLIVRIKEDETPDFCFSLKPGETLIGRESGDLIFSTDNLLSRRHLRILVEDQKITLEDLGSTNGTYLRLRQGVSLQNGDYIMIGKQILRFDILEERQSPDSPEDMANRTMMLGSMQPSGHARLVKQLFYGQNGNEYLLAEDCTTIGREVGDISFRNDAFVSPKHARILKQNNSYVLEDLNSSKGTYIRLRSSKQVEDSDFFAVGNQLFQVKINS